MNLYLLIRNKENCFYLFSYILIIFIMEKENKKIEINQEPEKIYLDINPDIPVNEIESYCTNCEKNGTTRILITKIPFFKDIIIMAFECPNCGWRNNEVQTAGQLADYGIKYVVKIINKRDLDRRVVKTEFAEIQIPSIGFEIPKITQKSKLSTIEGFISCARDDMQKALDEGIYDTVDEKIRDGIKQTIQNLTDILEERKLPCEFILTDPSGNSFVENPFAPSRDVYCTTTHFVRTKEMSEAMGYSLENQQNQDSENVISFSNAKIGLLGDENKGFEVYKSKSHISAHLMDMTKSIEEKEGSDAIVIPEVCLVCGKMGENRVCVISIPYFKELIITCFSCDSCSFKSSEVKGGGGISEKGSKITLKLTSKEDLNRDLFKSETSQIIIPELNFESGSGSLGSMFTTVEGLIDKLINNIKNTPFAQGDSCENSKKFDDFVKKLEDIVDSEKEFFPFTLIINDPASNSFLFSINHENPENDKNMIIEEYERDWEQNEDLGINGMKTENYQEDFIKDKKIEESKKITTIKEEDLEEYDKAD